VCPARPFPSSTFLRKSQSIWTDSKMETAGSQRERPSVQPPMECLYRRQMTQRSARALTPPKALPTAAAHGGGTTTHAAQREAASPSRAGACSPHSRAISCSSVLAKTSHPQRWWACPGVPSLNLGMSTGVT
jgi:hypothetical protein